MASQLRVLVVDDEECMRASITMILHFHGFAAESASNSSEAIQKMSLARFDIVITDLRMSGPEDGLVVLEAARRYHPGIITLLMSAYPDVSSTTSGIRLRSDEIVEKPIDIPALIRKLENRLSTEQAIST
jgi:DNA-binding NtrC family response regulator